jgi:large conductance mechanosensitive channel
VLIHAIGNVVDLAIGLIIGSAFSQIISSAVTDIIMPPIGLIVGRNFENWFWVIKHGKTPGMDYHTVDEAQSDGAVTENIGIFIQTLINFLLIALVLFCIIRCKSSNFLSDLQKCSKGFRD